MIESAFDGLLLILQSAFDSSDHRKADHAVRNYSVGGRTLGPFLEQRRPNAGWSSEITHGCRGVVRVTYGDTAFDYDVPGHGIHPGNEAGRQFGVLRSGKLPAQPHFRRDHVT